MNFMKVTLNIIMMCTVVQASESGRELAIVKDATNNAQSLAREIRDVNAEVQGMQPEIQKRKQRGSCCCSCVKKTVMTVAALYLALAGWKAYEHELLQADIQDLPHEINACTNACMLSDATCYDKCTRQVFADTKEETWSIGRNAIKHYRKNLGWNYRRCLKIFSKKDSRAKFNPQECVDMVVEHVQTDKNRDANFVPSQVEPSSLYGDGLALYLACNFGGKKACAAAIKETDFS